MKLEQREFERTFKLEQREIDKDARTVSAALSSETPVDRYFGTEILVHEKTSINMERAKDGLPLLWAHDHTSPIGRVENIRLDSDRILRGDFRFSRNAKAEEIWGDVQEGFLRDVSIGYRIDEYEINEDEDEVRVTRFTPLEASIVTVPADSRVGINRNNSEVTIMGKETEIPGAVAGTQNRQQEQDVGGELRLLRLDKERERKAGAQLERERIRGIEDLFDRYEMRFGEGTFSELKRLCLDNTDINIDHAKRYIDDAILDGHVSIDVSARQDPGSAFIGLPNIQRKSGGIMAGEDQMDKFQRGCELALSIRAGHVVKPDDLKEAQSGEFLSMNPTEMAREYLRLHNQRATGNREQVIAQALRYGQRDGMSHGVGHFASILENVASKSMLDGFMQAEETWSVWTQQKSIPDFKTASLLNLSLFSGLGEVKENAQYEYGDMSDIKEQIQLATYGRLFSISRQALANDDLSALGEIPAAMGMAAAYQIGDIVYAVLTNGTTVAMLQDSTALFHADHSNYVTSGAAPSVGTLNAGRTAMATQTDPQGKVIGLRPAYLIVPIALQTTAETLIAATYDPAGTAGTLTPNPFQNAMKVVADHRLDTANAAGWYLAARRNTVVVGFLNGQQAPYMESKDGWSVDGVEYKVRIDAAAAASDFRGLYYNDGVT